MNTLVALALAGGAIVALETGALPIYRVPIVLGLDELLGRPKTLGDGKFQPDTERAYCSAQCELAQQLANMSPFEAARLCGTTNPADLRCRALKECEICEHEITRPIVAPTVAEFAEGAKDAVVDIGGAIGDAIGGAISGVFGDFAWLLLAGGIAYLVLR